jgi:hypothetical protein
MKKISKKVEDKHLTEDEAEILRRYPCFTGLRALALLLQKAAPSDKKRQEIPMRGARAKSGARPYDAPPVLGDDSAELSRHERDRHAPHHRRHHDAQYCSAWACSWIV